MKLIRGLVAAALVLGGCGDDDPSSSENRPPEIADLTLMTDEDDDVTGTVDVSDPDGDAVTLTVEQPANGEVTRDGARVTYTPEPDFHGTDSFVVRASDGREEVEATVEVTVAPVNDAPVGGPDSFAADEDTPLLLSHAALLGNDSDVDGDALSVSGVGNPDGGAVESTDTGVTFTPAPDFAGEASFEYTVSDGQASATVAVTVTVGGANDAPIAVDDIASTPEDTPLAVAAADLLANDTEPDGQTMTITEVTPGASSAVGFDGTTITFTPDPDVFGDLSFTYTVSDGAETDVGLVTVTVTPVNDPPVAQDDSATVAEDSGSTQIDVLANDSSAPDTGETLAVIQADNPVGGTVAIAGGGSAVIYTPDPDFFGTASFAYTVSDGNGGTDSATVTVTVTAVGGDAPVAADDTATVRQNSGVTTISVLSNDVDPDGQSISVTSVTEAPSGTSGIAPGGAGVTYQPDPDFFGADTFTYTVADPDGMTDTATVTVTVTACGDNVTQAGDGEECDDANSDETDGCTSQCVDAVVCDATAFPGGDRFAVDPGTGNCFVSFDGGTPSFDAAHLACVDLGGHLATITSADEDAIVFAVQNTLQTPWIGARSLADNAFTWVTGEPLAYTNYAAGEPTPSGAAECLQLATPTGEWGDTFCTAGSAIGYICELESEPCGDGVTQPALGEECDVAADADCDAGCQLTAGCGDGDLDASEECDDDNLQDGDGCTAACMDETLHVSEYVEGTSFNKAIEIRNPLATAADLAAMSCSLRLYSNGSITPSNTLPLTGTIAGGDVLVLCHPSAGPDVLAACDVQDNAVINFNGDDAIDLVCGGETLDVIGQIGTDPGTAWGTAPTTTLDATLRRQCGITSGDPVGSDAFDPSLEWVGFATDTFGGLGDPACAP